MIFLYTKLFIYWKNLKNIEGCHEQGAVMGLGNQSDDQSQVFVMCADLPRSPGHVFYDRLQSVLIKGGFDRFVEMRSETGEEFVGAQITVERC